MTNRYIGDTEPPYAPREAAAVLGVNVRTVTRMAERGKLHPITLPSGHRRYLRAEIDAYARPTKQAKR